MANKLHIRQPGWSENGRNYTNGLTMCGKDVHAESPTGKANRIMAVYPHKAQARIQSAQRFGDMCKRCNRYIPN